MGHRLRAQLDPSPPLAFARTLSAPDKHDVAHAAIDLSDGLSGDLLALCELSGLVAWIDPDDVPVDPRVRRIECAQSYDPLPLALYGGEDYQMLLAVPEENLDRLKDLAVVWDLPITVVGRFIEGEPGVSLRKGDDFVPLIAKSYDHFRRLRGHSLGIAVHFHHGLLAGPSSPAKPWPQVVGCPASEATAWVAARMWLLKSETNRLPEESTATSIGPLSCC